jgi:hypothetical protein
LYVYRIDQEVDMPSIELQPGPPFNQIVISSTGAPTVG